MSVAMSVLPLPLVAWHMAQSMVHHFLARARDSGEDLTGLACLAASTGMTAVAVFCGGCCAGSAAAKRNATKRSSARQVVDLDIVVNIFVDIGTSDERFEDMVIVALGDGDCC